VHPNLFFQQAYAFTIKLVHLPGEELKFVVELPGEKQITFIVDRHQIVGLACGLQ